MAKDKISDYSATANSNTDIGGINIDEGCAPSGINDAIRTLMKQLKDWQSGSQDVYIHPAGSASVPSITATGDTNTGLFFPAADTIALTTGGTERARVDSSGNLGLGVTPSAWATYKALQVDNGAIANYSPTQDASYLSNAYYNAGWKYIASAYALRYAQDGSGGSHKWYNAASGTAGNAISFTQAMTLDASGQLGIGVTSSSAPLTIASANTAAAVHIRGRSSDGYGDLIFYSDTGGTQYGFVEGGTTGLNLSGVGARSVIFGTNGSERARIDSSGNLLVGTTSAGAGNSRTYLNGDGTNPALRVLANTATTSVYAGVFRHESTTSGAYIQFVTDTNIETGRIYDSAGTMQYASSSDARLKTNVQPMQNSLQSVLALNPCTFDMRRGEDTFIPSAGLIAQEVHEVYPYVVGVGGDDENTNPWSVDYGKLTPLLVAAIKEQQAIITKLQADVAALKGQA